MHILQADHPTFPNWPQSSAEHEQAQKQRDTADLLREFEALRTASLELIESLQPEELSRSGHHQMAGDMTIQDLLHEWVFHDRDHTQQLYANVKAIAWPHMGNTQHFSTPPAT